MKKKKIKKLIDKRIVEVVSLMLKKYNMITDTDDKLFRIKGFKG